MVRLDDIAKVTYAPLDGSVGSRANSKNAVLIDIVKTQDSNTVDISTDVLTALDYLDGDKVTERGSHLRRLYSDMDLVAAESLREGLWDDLTPSELAAVLSALVLEARRPDEAAPPRVPGAADPWGPLTGPIDKGPDPLVDGYRPLCPLEAAHSGGAARRRPRGWAPRKATLPPSGRGPGHRARIRSRKRTTRR